ALAARSSMEVTVPVSATPAPDAALYRLSGSSTGYGRTSPPTDSPPTTSSQGLGQGEKEMQDVSKQEAEVHHLQVTREVRSLREEVLSLRVAAGSGRAEVAARIDNKAQ
ncbi:unnamed protein product, partial [Polarella glacialis]